MAEVVIEDIEGILEEIAKNVDLTAENIHDGMIVIVVSLSNINQYSFLELAAKYCKLFSKAFFGTVKQYIILMFSGSRGGPY